MAKTNKSAGGIGESKIFCAPDDGKTPDPILACHINGVLISELDLEPHVVAVLNRQFTDEGIAEHDARPDVRESSGITQGAGAWEKSLEQRRDDVKDRDMDLYQARDPFKEVADAFVAPGMRARMLSKTKLKEGAGDHQIVKYPAGHAHAGDPVMVKGMVLGEMPERRAIARNKFYRSKTADLLKQVEAKHQLQPGGVGPSQD